MVMANFRRIKTKVDKKRSRKKEKKSRSMKKRQSFSERHGMRRSILGRMTEDRVAGLLAKKQEAGELVSFERYPANSPEDAEGKDFRVSKEINGEVVSASFGITISMREHQDHLMKHPHEPSIIIPPEMNDERIWWRITKILKEKKNARA